MSSDSIKSNSQNIENRSYEINLNSLRFNYANIIIPFSKFIKDGEMYTKSKKNNFKKLSKYSEEFRDILKKELF